MRTQTVTAKRFLIAFSRREVLLGATGLASVAILRWARSRVAARDKSVSLGSRSAGIMLAAVTKRLELMVAVRPTFHNSALLAKDDRYARTLE